MTTDTEIKVKGIEILEKSLGPIDAERFIALIQRELFDYTKRRQQLDQNKTIQQISEDAMKLRKKEEQAEH